ncbi:hypothetical protein PLICRDRAFT_701595 [Plicaturopsis crispa FD-325 SS-3]|uniref:Uncharacterized protein n=1 Tax=Plicaturopsis crispa FD-325 SS-3 TaxID=944288 RepID=A0A0C9T9E1_PLICR|nr:hypothetical protein PLICRDRAFT_701595 [Plicaturopsis crispa FD-325 SS-3]
MSHRTSPRLLSNLSQHEKAYTAHLLALPTPAAPFLAAYAPTTAPIADALTRADEALRLWAASGEAWEDILKELKNKEEEVGNVLRDREILVTRLIKASKSKPSRMAGLPSSSSTTSLPAATSNIKLSAAQAELQACEAHLALLQRQLEEMRVQALGTGLRERCRALVACSEVLGECGRVGAGYDLTAINGTAVEHRLSTANLNAANAMSAANGDARPFALNLGNRASVDRDTPPSTAQGAHTSSVDGRHTPSAHNDGANEATRPGSALSGSSTKPLPTPFPASPPQQDQHPERPSSEQSSIAPSQSASQIHVPATYAIPSHPSTQSATDLPIPRSTYISRNRPPSRVLEEPESESESEEPENVRVIENTRFAGSTSKLSSADKERSAHRFSIRGRPKDVEPRVEYGGETTTKRERKSSASGGFFGSIRGLFKHDHMGSQPPTPDSSHNAPSRSYFSTQASPTKASFWGKEKDGWGARTDRNLKSASKRNGDSSDEEDVRAPVYVPPPRKTQSDVGAPGVQRSSTSSKRLQKGKRRTVPAQDAVGNGLARGGSTASKASKLNGAETTKPEAKATYTNKITHEPESTPSAPANGNGNSNAPIRRTSVRSLQSSPSPPRIIDNTHTHASHASSTASLKAHPRKHERRASASAAVLPQGESLLSIVEGVAQLNRSGSIGGNSPSAGSGISGLVLPSTLEHMAPRPALKREVSQTRHMSLPLAYEPVPVVPASSSLGSDLSRSSSVSTSGKPASRPAKSPLRSALRNGSRSPSPQPPLPAGAAHLAKSSNVAERRGRSSSPVLRGPKAPPSPRPPPPEVRLNGQRRKSIEVDDTSSVSSYETVHENFGEQSAKEDGNDSDKTEHERGDGTDTEREDGATPPPPVPPHDYAHTASAMSHGGSDLSSASTETPPNVVTRRKSVRVSLQPTFSPTPPAIDDDDESGRHSPWGKSSRDPVERDMWEDSSEEDVEYKKAKKLLSRVAKKARGEGKGKEKARSKTVARS